MTVVDADRALGHGRFARIDGPRGVPLAFDRLTRVRSPLPDAGGGPAALVRAALGAALLPAATGPVGDRPVSPDDRCFWQFPARTEADAADRHAARATAPAAQQGDTVQVYLGLPWATWIDMQRRGTPDARVDRELAMQRIRLQGLRRALDACGLSLRVHTVCQHVYWERLVPTWQALGVTDLWLSHAASAPAAAPAGLVVHPWSLWAVNVEDPARRDGLCPDADPADRPLLASFVGTHAAHYVSDTRLRLRALAGVPGFVVESTPHWHYEDVVYRHQVQGEPLAPDAGHAVRTRRYNQLLSSSRFSLCPVGAGSNTLRLWESLAAGAVPVLCGPPPRLPRGGTLPDIDWDSIVLHAGDDALGELPAHLAAIPLHEVRARQQRGREAYRAVRAQCCFA